MPGALESEVNLYLIYVCLWILEAVFRASWHGVPNIFSIAIPSMFVAAVDRLAWAGFL